MTDPLVELARSLTVRVSSATNLPTTGFHGAPPDPCCKISLIGPIRSFVGKTGVASQTCDPIWNSAPMHFNAVRGLTIQFRIVNKSGKGTKEVAVGYFSPNFLPMGNAVTTKVPLFCFRQTKPKPDEATFLEATISYTPRVVETIPIGCPKLATPVYLTLNTSNTIRMRAPYDSNFDPNVRGLLPYRFPYDLGVALLNESTGQYEYICSSNRAGHGAWHSGKNICGGRDSIAPVIRLDPAVLLSNGYRKVVVIVSTPNFSTLKSQFASAFVTVWMSREEPGAYRKGCTHKLNTAQLLDLRPVGQFDIKLGENEIGSMVACVKAVVSAPSTIEFAPIQYFLPNQDVSLAPQNPSEAVPAICKGAKISETGFRVHSEFPLYTPRSLTLATKTGRDVKITARATRYKTHMCSVHAVSIDKKVLATCNEGQPSVLNGAFKWSTGTLTVDLGVLDNNVSFVLFTVFGPQMLVEDPGRYDTASQNMTAFVNQTAELLKAPYKFSRTKNGIMWFGLARDAFSGWAVVNLRTSANVPNDESLVLKFADMMKSILTLQA